MAAGSGVLLASVLVCVLTLTRLKSILAAARQSPEAAKPEHSQEFADLRARVDSLADQIVEMRAEPAHPAAEVPVAAPFKPGLNLNKRSQALRMHRRGDRAEDIALALDVPLQEVELLVKVHRIVLSTI